MIKGNKTLYATSLNSTPAQIFAVNVDRLNILVRNLGPDPCWIYTDDASVAFPLLSGDIFEDDVSFDAWSGLSSGTSVLRSIETTAV